MTIEPLSLTTSDGVRLSGDVHLPAGAPVGVGVICHPHPLYGGDRHNHVVEALFRTLPRHGVAAIRFDFRGAGASEGTHDAGVGERRDVAAAVDVAASAAVPIVLVGYSFGGRMVLGEPDPRVTAWVAVAPPLGVTTVSADADAGLDAVGSDARHKLLLIPEHDQYAPPSVVSARSQRWVNAAIAAIPMADHFLNGHVAYVAGQVGAFCELAVRGGLP